jgi:hypothetical protein
MFAVVIQASIDVAKEDQARQMVRDVFVPRVRAMDGFVSGTWLRAQDDRGITVLLFETKEAAVAAAEEIRSQGPPPGAPAKLVSAEAFEVIAQA